ncbi:MAG: nitroreductase family protein [Bacillota bacterium]
MDKVLEIIEQRRSVRKYSPQPLEREKIELLLAAAVQAPSGHNAQPWHFTVISNVALLDSLAGECKKYMAASGIDWAVKMAALEQLHIFYHAPAVIIVSAVADAPTPEEDTAAATQNIMLQAASMGLGSCWIGLAWFYFKDKANYAQWGIPENCTVQQIMTVGYPQGASTKPLRKPFSVNWVN